MMEKVNMHEAKTHLSALVEKASRGEGFIIAKAGKPMVKVVPYKDPIKAPRTGFLKGEFVVPKDFDTMYQAEIVELFGEGK